MGEKRKTGNWVVRMTRTVVTEIACGDCTREEAESDPFEHTDGDELEIEQTGYEVISVKPNV